MTANRNRKQAIRERMARTGEKYTVAAAALDAELAGERERVAAEVAEYGDLLAEIEGAPAVEARRVDHIEWRPAGEVVDLTGQPERGGVDQGAGEAPAGWTTTPAGYVVPDDLDDDPRLWTGEPMGDTGR